MILIAPHQHCVMKPASAAARYWSSRRKRAPATARYGRASEEITSPLERVQRVEAGDDLLDRRRLHVHVLHLEAGGDVRDELVRRDPSGIERQLDRPSLAPAYGGVRHVERLDVAREMHPQPMLGQHTTAEQSEGAVGEDESVPDDDHALGERLDVVHVVRGEDHRYAALAIERLHEVAHGELGDGIEAD